MLMLDAEGVAGFFLLEGVGPCLAGCLVARNVASPTARWGEQGTPKSSSDSSAEIFRRKPLLQMTSLEILSQEGAETSQEGGEASQVGGGSGNSLSNS